MQLGTGSLSTVKVARQPILSAGPGHPVVGYELLFSDSGSLFGAFADVDDFRASDEILEFVHAALVQALLFLGGVILRILGKIAM